MLFSSTSGGEWRKQQLDKLERKHRLQEKVELPAMRIEREEDLQPMWKEMERRVRNRRSLTAQERGGRIGRINVRRTDEDVWLEEGLYDKPNKAGS